MPCDSPNSDEMVPKVRPVDINRVVYIASLPGEPNHLVAGYTPTIFVPTLTTEKQDEGDRRGNEVRDRNKGAGADEIERRQQSECQRAQPSDQRVILADRAGKHHADQIGRKHCLAVRPGGERAHSQQAQQQEFGFELRRTIAIEAKKSRRDPGKHDKDDNPDTEENQCLDRERAKISPSATTVPKSVTKHAARMVLPYSVVLNPNSSITA